MKEFKEVTKRDALNHMQNEINSLLNTVPDNKKPLVQKELNGFTKLFERFIAESEPFVDWNKIQRLPDDIVSITRI